MLARLGGGAGKWRQTASLRMNAARRRGKGAQRARSSAADESLLSEETSASNAWPRALPADGGHENGYGHGCGGRIHSAI